MSATSIVWFPWKQEYSVSLPEIDRQHKRLVQLINNLHQAMAEGQGTALLGRLLDELVSYTKSHFAAEEHLMQKCAYPDYRQHRQEHADLTTAVLKFAGEFKAGRTAVSVQVMQFLKTWLTGHILGSDRRFAPFLLDAVR